MRVIKFRAWWRDRAGNAFELIEDLEDRYITDLNASHLIVEQYTGLKDRNGQEIYEGDIVTAHRFLFDGTEVESFGIIGSNDFGWTLSRVENSFYEDYTGYNTGEGESNLGDFYGLHEESFEIIGNIHENPELLK